MYCFYREKGIFIFEMVGERKGFFFQGIFGNRFSGDGVGFVVQRIRVCGYELWCWGFEFFFVYNWFKREGFFFLGGQENYVWDSDSGFKVMEFGDGFFVEIEWSDFFFYLNLDIYLLYLLFF